jgi:hypothetical protein
MLILQNTVTLKLNYIGRKNVIFITYPSDFIGLYKISLKFKVVMSTAVLI